MGAQNLTALRKTPNTRPCVDAQTDVQCEGCTSKGKQPSLAAKVPKPCVSGKRLVVTMTTRRLAWKQPCFNESVIAH